MRISSADYYKEVDGRKCSEKKEVLVSFLLRKRIKVSEEEGDVSHSYFKRKNLVTRNHMAISENIYCPLCKDLFVNTATTICGHSFCEVCLFEYMLNKQQCPHCRQSIKFYHFLYNKCFDRNIQQIIDSSQNQQIIHTYKLRKTENDNWNKLRKLINVQIGQEVDVLDTEHVWCKGSIKQITQSKKNVKLLIHYKGWNKFYDEFLSLNSNRVASLGFFTNRKDIPYYQQDGQDDAMQNHIVLQNPLNQVNIIVSQNSQNSNNHNNEIPNQVPPNNNLQNIHLQDNNFQEEYEFTAISSVQEFLDQDDQE